MEPSLGTVSKAKSIDLFGEDFTVDEVKCILKQPPSNDHYRFDVMHYMHYYTGDYRGANLVCMKWFHILRYLCSCVLNYLLV